MAKGSISLVTGVTFVATLGGLLFGYDTAVISGAVSSIDANFWSFKILIGNSTLNALFNHGFPYWVYGVMSFLGAAFVYFYVPETKRRTLEEIQNLWTRGSGAPAAALKQPAAG